MNAISGPAMPATAETADVSATPRLKSAAHEFEASLMKELLTPMQRSSALFAEKADEEESGLSLSSTSSEDDSGNALVEFGSEAMARAISDRGGMGIATRILKSLSPVAEKNPDRY